MNYLVLFSGGMDSTVSLMVTLRDLSKTSRKGEVHAITYYYGQRHSTEITAAQRIWHFLRGTSYNSLLGNYQCLNISPHLMPRVGSLMGAEQVCSYGDGPIDETIRDSSFIPHRNLLFLTIAAMWARAWSAKTIVTGLRGGFPDCTAAFERGVERLLWRSDPDWPIEIVSHVHMSRADCVMLASTIEHGLDAISWSLTCFHGTEPPCGKCLPCRKRAEGFAEARIPDPLLQRLSLA